MSKSTKIEWHFGPKHKEYIRECRTHDYNIAEGAIRAGKTIDNIFAFAWILDETPDKIHLASGSTLANAKLNIGECNGFGLEYQFRGRCKWGKFKDNDCLYIKARHYGRKIVIFAGSGKADSYRKIRGNSYGMWIATEINLHHDSFIKEAFNRTAASKLRKFFWDLNPDTPQSFIYTNYIDAYRKKAEAGAMSVNYQLFTLKDNITITPDRMQEIILQYDPSTVWYRRDILGERCAVEGVVYRVFADHPQTFYYTHEVAQNVIPTYFVMGVDFGGDKSAHAFTLTGFTRGFGAMITLEEYYRHEVISPTELESDFIEFVRMCQTKYPVRDCYCDSAETTLIRGFQNAVATERIPLMVHNAQKCAVNDRIRCMCRLQSAGRYYIDPKCVHTIEALRTALWDSKHITEDVRLDDGTTNIDSLDALEYTYERNMRELINARWLNV